ncbi:hypothetical protein IAE22_35520, partial [Bacillus sp. S34]|nr:hypothetical protein [Bacillus sp. S34]
VVDWLRARVGADAVFFAGDDVTVTTHAALGLTKTPVAKVGSTTAAKRVTAGAEQVWLLQVRNEGPSDEQPTTVVTDQLP